MQLIIIQKLKEPLVLPVNHQHILQSIIYHNLITANGFSDHLHDNGYVYGKRKYKLFTFSWLQGNYTYNKSEKTITFYDKVTLEVRSTDINMLQILAENIKKNGIHYNENHVQDVKLILKDHTIEFEKVHIKMETPVCVYSTNPENHFTKYYSPSNPEFSKLINDNFCRKYIAYYGLSPEESIDITPINVTDEDEKVIKFQNSYICGWKGEYLLTGKRKYLDFLFQTGLGSKNSQGFGMWTNL